MKLATTTVATIPPNIAAGPVNKLHFLYIIFFLLLLLFYCCFFFLLSPDFRERKRALRPFWSSKWAGPPSICLFNFSWVYWKHSCNFNLLSTNYGMSDNVFSLYIPTKSSIKCNIVQVVLYYLAFISNYLHND